MGRVVEQSIPHNSPFDGAGLGHAASLRAEREYIKFPTEGVPYTQSNGPQQVVAFVRIPLEQKAVTQEVHGPATASCACLSDFPGVGPVSILSRGGAPRRARDRPPRDCSSRARRGVRHCGRAGGCAGTDTEFPFCCRGSLLICDRISRTLQGRSILLRKAMHALKFYI